MTATIHKDTTAFSTLRVLAADIKIAHSVFALPFAVLGAFMAASRKGMIDWSRMGGQLTLVVLAMVLARSVAMLMNRLIDRKIDATNPRTQGRALPSGKLTVGIGVLAVLVIAGLFMLVCVAFGYLYGNWWPTRLGVPVLVWISVYAFFKRFTWLCHLYLGSSLAISPLAAAIAIDPVALNQPALWLMSGMVMCWVAGFDVIYALQDVKTDREQGLYSMPSKLGEKVAMRIARLLHVACVGLLLGALLVDARFGVFFGVGVLLVAVLLIYEHATVARWGTTKMALAFFTLNGVVSCVLGTLGVVDFIW